MANILFISVNDINAQGVRILSSLLKKEGHETSILFLKRPGYPYSNYNTKFYWEALQVSDEDWAGIDCNLNFFRYSRGPEITATEQNLLLAHIRQFDPALIGFSVTVPLMNRIAAVTKFIKAHVPVPVIWGGAAPTTVPEECIQHCDYACIGEGEAPLSEIVARLEGKVDFDDVRGLSHQRSGEFVRNPLHPLERDLNTLPFPDVDPRNKHLIEDDALIDDFGEISYSGKYHVMGSRGCPFRCSYCSESLYKSLYAPQRFLRRRSPQSIIAELKEARLQVDFQAVQFEDEVFCLEHDWLEEFTDLYTKEISLPFSCYIFPINGLHRQMVLLKKAGVTNVCLSLQSGSERINKRVFQRPFSKQVYVDTARMLHSMGIPFYTDIITYNPFETEDDLEATLGILREIPRPTDLYVNKLSVLKNTALSNLIERGEMKHEIGSVSAAMFLKYVRLFFEAVASESAEAA
jgi:radical SAM superfamily enzyme YgiQ (UPF0313 family)